MRLPPLRLTPNMILIGTDILIPFLANSAAYISTDIATSNRLFGVAAPRRTPAGMHRAADPGSGSAREAVGCSEAQGRRLQWGSHMDVQPTIRVKILPLRPVDTIINQWNKQNMCKIG